jgi:hypothetical protein
MGPPPPPKPRTPPFNTFGPKGTRAKINDKPKQVKLQWKVSQLYTDFGLPPKMVRTPRCHRLKHKRPAEIRQAMQIFPKLWQHGDKKKAWGELKNKIDGILGTGSAAMSAKYRAESKRCFEIWL